MISEIEIRLRADVARLQQDMDKARKAVGSGLDGINTAVAKTVGLLGGLAVGAAAVNFGRFIKGSIDAADALNDLSARTQVAIEDLAGLEFAAKMTGTTLEGAAGAVNKLSQNVGKETEKFRALGVTATEPIEAFKQLAEIFKSIQDPQQRAAFGAAALGKSWAEVAPLLSEGAVGIDKLVKRGKELSGVTESMVQDAAKFNDKLDELGTIAAGAGTRMASDLLPLLNQLVDDLTSTGDGAVEANKGFSLLAETMRVIVLAGGNIAFTFKAVGNSLGGVSAQVGLVNEAFREFFKFNDVVTNAQNAWGKLKMAFGAGGVGDMATADAEKARAAFDKWESGWQNLGKGAKTATDEVTAFMDSVDAAVAGGANAMKAAEFLKADEIAAARKKVADESAAAAKKEQDAYAGLIATLREKQAVNQFEIDNNKVMTEGQKAVAKLDADLASGKLVLTRAHEAEVRGIMAAVDGQDQYLAAAKKTKTAVDALDDERRAAFQAALAEADALEKTAVQFGMTEKAIQKATLARLEERLAQRQSLELDAAEVDQLEKLIDAKKRSAAATETIDALQQQKKAAEDAAAAQKSFWESIDKTAHDTFVSIANGNKDVWQRMKETAKNMFFDWLYQMTLKKWVINIGTSMGLGGASGLAQAATGAGGALGGLGSIGGILGAVGSVGTGALQTAGALLSGNIGFGSTLSAGISAIGTGSLSGITAGLSSVIGTLGPIAVGIAGAVSVLKKAFGHGAREVTSQGITGTFSPNGFTGKNFQEWLEKGGWFSSDRKGVTESPISGELQAQLSDSFNAIKTATSSFATALGLPVDTIQNYSAQLKLVLSGDITKDQQAIADALIGIGDQMALSLLPNLTALAVKGETASTTLQRIATNYTALDAILTTMGDHFGAVGAGSLEARERLIALAGGLDKLAANAQTFAQNFLTEAERLAPVQAEVTKRMAELGLAAVTTRDQFKDIVLGLDLTTEAGARQYAAMLELSGAFAAVTKSAQDATAAAEAAAQAARDAEKARQEAAREAVRDAYGALEKAVSARKSALQEQFQATAASFDVVINAAQAGADRFRAMAADLRGTAARIGGGAQTSMQAAASGRAAADQLSTLAAKGMLLPQGQLQSLIDAAQRQPSGAFATFEEFQRSQVRTAANVSVLAEQAEKNATGLDRMAAAVGAQKAAAEAAALREQEQLDAMLEAAKGQLVATQGTTDAVLSVSEALSRFAAAVSAATAGGGGGGGMGITSGGNTGAVITGSPSFVTQFWEGTALDFSRRGPLKGFANGGMFGGGLRMVGERGPELEVTGPARYYSNKQTSTMMGEGNNAVVDELRMLNERMANMEQSMDRTSRNTGRTASSSDQLARQFDQASGGGSALATVSMGSM